jgi:DNA-binding transcriptional LysR family regulator
VRLKRAPCGSRSTLGSSWRAMDRASARVQEDLNVGRLVVANPLHVETDSSYFLTYPRERSHLRRIKALEDWITLA